MKPGWKTTEFLALMVAPFLPALAAAVEALVAPGQPYEHSPWAPVATSVAAGMYALARALIKAQVGDKATPPEAP